jgi:hypothetical protein
MVELYELYLEEMKRTTTAIERIAYALEHLQQGSKESDRHNHETHVVTQPSN